MNYPLISEYVEAIKAAEDNFDQLKHLRPVLGEDGEPVMSSGGFAVVFKMKDEQTGILHAVKCFLKEQEGRAEAYRQIAEELEYVSSTFLTPIKYLDKELFVDSANSEDSEFPVLLMDWVEGQTLDKYILEHIDDQYELSLLAYQFSRLAMWLMPQPFAHGDLKPDNILVKEDGTLVLVDYDGMYVPAMKGQKARELGSPDFRHPSRTEEVFDEHIDDFSLASILLSLKAIALQPTLLEEYGASDRLLFSEKDYRNLSESSALGALQPLMQDAELASLYSLYILALSQNNLSQVSFRLFNLSRPDRSQYEEENLSTKVTEEDLANAWTDEYGAKYSYDGNRLLSGPKKDCHSYMIKEGTITICDNSIKSIPNREIVIPSTVQIIGENNFSGFSGGVVCKSEYFIIENDLLLTRDKSRLISCLTHEKKVIVLPKETSIIDRDAFFDDSYYHYDYENHLCFIMIQNPIINGFRCHCNIIVPNPVVEENIISIGILKDFIYVGEIYIDEFGVIYSADMDKLICLPRELDCVEYNIAEGCKEILWIEGLADPDEDGIVTIIGNKVQSLYLPSSLIRFDEKQLEACNCINSLIVPQGTLDYFADLLPHYSQLIKENVVNLSTKVTKEDLINAWADEYGVKYSIDRKRLLKAPQDIEKYTIKGGTKVICDSAFRGCESLNSITIPNNVIEIGDYAFAGCLSMVSISIPNSVKSIGNSAFRGCMFPLLDLLTIPDGVVVIGDYAFAGTGVKIICISKSVRSIGDYAFARCESLKSIFISEGVESFGKGAFRGCSDLSSVHFPYSVTEIGEEVFCGCSSLKYVWLPPFIQKISSYMFAGCYCMRYIEIPDSVISIGYQAFCNCYGLRYIDFGDSVTEIGGSAFWNSDCIHSIKLPKSVKRIWKEAFKSKYLETITIPESVTYIEEDALYECEWLEEVTFEGKVPEFGGSIFKGCNNLMFINVPVGTKKNYEKQFLGFTIREQGEEIYPLNVTEKNLSKAWDDGYGVKYSSDLKRLLSAPKSLTDYSVKDGTMVICNGAFSGCEKLSLINIPASLTEIGEFSFTRCYGLQSIVIPDSISAIGEGSFYECLNLQQVKMPQKLTFISPCAFKFCPNLSSVIIPENVESIGYGAFWGCKSLTSIVIPEKTSYICENAFRFCENLKTIRINSKDVKIDKEAFYCCNKLSSIVVPKRSKENFEKLLPEFKDKLVELDDETEVTDEDLANVWTEDDGIKYCQEIEQLLKNGDGLDGFSSVINGKQIVSQGVATMEGFLISTTLPDTITIIGKYAFKGCDFLYAVNIPNSVTNIEDGAFQDCRHLYSVDIPQSVTHIGECVFSGCYHLESVSIPDSVTCIGKNVFKLCNNIRYIYIPIGKGPQYDNLLPKMKSKFVELIDINKKDGWRVKKTRPFSPDEIAAVARAEVVPSQYGNSVCFFMNGGGQTYIPLLGTSSLTVGDSVDLKTAKLVTLCREGYDDIYRVLE